MAKLKLKSAVEDDRTEICALMKAVHLEGLFQDIPFSQAKFDRFFDNTLNNPDQHLGLKVSLDGKIIGCSYCQCGGYFIGDGARVVAVNTICVDAEARASVLGGKVALRLLSGIEVWARAQKAHFVLYHVTSGTDLTKVDRFFRRMGMTSLGGNYGVKL